MPFTFRSGRAVRHPLPALALLALLGGLPPALPAAPPSPLIVQADVLPARSASGAPACALFVSASDISGDFVALALRWSRDEDGALALELRLSPGQVDWTNGIETAGYAVEGWVRTPSLDLREALVAEAPGQADVYIARLARPELARPAFDALLSEPLEVLYSTGPEDPPRVFVLGEALEADVRARARQCVEGLPADGGAVED